MLKLSSGNGTIINFIWDPIPAKSQNGTLFIGWVSWLQKPVYTPITLTSPNSGTTSVPSELRGFVIAVLTDEMPEQVYNLTSASISGPILAKVVS